MVTNLDISDCMKDEPETISSDGTSCSSGYESNIYTIGQYIFYLTIKYNQSEGSIRGAIKLKNVPKSGKSPKGGKKGSAQKIKKSTIQNVDFLTRGGAIF